MSRSRLLLRITALSTCLLGAACGGAAPHEAAAPRELPEAPAVATSRARPEIAIRQVAAAPAEHALGAKAERAAASSFPRDDARTAMKAASRGIRMCRVEGGPSEIDAVVRFEPSGKVSRVDVGPAVGRTATCVTEHLSAVALMPFDGSAVDVKLRVTL